MNPTDAPAKPPAPPKRGSCPLLCPRGKDEPTPLSTNGQARKAAKTTAHTAYKTKLGRMFHGKSEDVLGSRLGSPFKGRVQLVFTSPPFPLNRKKRYGNEKGQEFVVWLAKFAPLLRDYLTKDGSIVLEMGNAWEPGEPVMSTLALEALLEFKKAASLKVCQQFICYNPARLPAPAQWVNVDRIRVKDAYTHVWWMSRTAYPKANNRAVLTEYSKSMKSLLKSGKYNSGHRPSEYAIGEKSFLTNNGGAIPSNVFTMPNTGSHDPYQTYCRNHGLRSHPARMPRALAEFFVNFLTEPGDIVLDPFGGSNTTGIAAEDLGRRWISIEADRDYVRGSRGRFLPPEPEKVE